MPDPTGPTNAPTAVDPNKPSIARVYDYCLGGKDNYEIDRVVFNSVGQMLPAPEQLAKVNRSFMIRAVRWLARDAGIDQFLDCGSGLPTMQNVHQVAQHHQPEATVVYVDNDPVVQAHGRALLEDNDRTFFAGADFTQPDRLLTNEIVTSQLDFTRPIGLVHCATLHHVPEEQDPWGVMRHLIGALPAGSFVALSHVHDPGDEHYGGIVRTINERAQQAGTGGGLDVRFRSRGQIEALFDGAELVDPGVVRLADWYPEGPAELHEPWDHLFLGGIGHKP